VPSLYDVIEPVSRSPQPETPITPPALEVPSSKIEEVERQLRDVRAEKLRRVRIERTKREVTESLEAFVKYFWRVLEPDVDLVWSWHLSLLCWKLDLVEETPDDKGVINVPPGTAKSLLLVFFRGKLWAKKPSYRFISWSYSLSLSVRDNIKLRTLVQSPEYQELFPNVQILRDSMERLDTTASGYSIASSVGGLGTGEHPDFKFIDDPITEVQSRSEAERLSVNNWIDRTITTRGVTRDVRLLLIMQRFHQDDPSGHVLSKGGWWHIKFPMRYETRKVDEKTGQVLFEPDPLDQRTEEGELLMPQLFTEAKVKALEIALGPYGTAGQLQQNPQPEGGGLFKRHWLPVVDALPAGKVSRRIRGWDTGGTEGGGDPTVGVKIAEVEVKPPERYRDTDGVIKTRPGEYQYYIEHVVWAQTDAPDKLILATAQADGRRVEQHEEKEPGSSGKAVITARATMLRGYSYRGIPTSGDKVTRAKPFRSQCEAGNVFLVRGEWNEEYIDELTNFPIGKRDDRVDGSSCSFNGFLMERPPQTTCTW
jgi:predicted phage terminase large subunit-like protein